MLRRPNNLTDSLIPLLSMNALIGHGIFYFPNQRQRPLFSMIYAIIFMALYLILFGFTLQFIFDQPWYGDDERIVFVVVYVNVGISIFAVILSWCNAKRFARIIEDLRKVDETLQELGATFNYTRVRNEGYGCILIWIISIVAFNWVDSLWFCNIMPVSQTYLIASVLHHPVHINSIVAFNFCMNVRLLGTRYKEANTILEGLRNPLQSIKINAWQNPRNNMMSPSIPMTISSFKTRQTLRIENRNYFIRIIKHVHLELGEIGKNLNKASGLHMAFGIADLFVMFTGFLYELYILIFDPSALGRLVRIVVLVIWIIIYLLKLVIINETCERVCKEAKRTGQIIHCLDEKIEDSELINEISQFSLQLLHDPLAFTPAGMITLGHKFVRKFLATVTTYLVILIQMTPSKSSNVKF